MTLVELLMATAIMGMIAVTLAAVGSAVQTSSEHHQGQTISQQHGRVAIERIQRSLSRATANEQFPGFFVFTERIGGRNHPDTLVVWDPVGAASDPGGMPLLRELLVVCTDSMTPNRLLECRLPNDSRTAPALSNSVAWANVLELFKSAAADHVELSDLVRVATPASGPSSTPRGVVCFGVQQQPTEAEWQAYQADALAWEDLSWPLGSYGGSFGLRRSCCQIELQMRAPDINDNSSEAAIPFFGSVAIQYGVER